MTNFYDQFPKLSALAGNLDNKVSRFKADREALETNDRYDQNEIEREYQLAELEEEREATLQKYEDDYQLELEAINLSLAEQAFEMPSASEGEINGAKETADSIKSMILGSFAPADVLPLLETRVKTMSDVEKSALSLQINEIASYAHDNVRFDDEKKAVVRYIDGIKSILTNTKQNRSIKEQRDALEKIRRGASSLRGKHDSLENGVKQALSSNIMNGER